MSFKFCSSWGGGVGAPVSSAAAGGKCHYARAPRAPRQVHVPLRQLPFLAASSSASSCRSPPECTRQAKRVTQVAGWHTHMTRGATTTLHAHRFCSCCSLCRCFVSLCLQLCRDHRSIMSYFTRLLLPYLTTPGTRCTCARSDSSVARWRDEASCRAPGRFSSVGNALGEHHKELAHTPQPQRQRTRLGTVPACSVARASSDVSESSRARAASRRRCIAASWDTQCTSKPEVSTRPALHWSALCAQNNLVSQGSHGLFL